MLKNGVEILSNKEATAFKNKLDRDLYRKHSVNKNYFSKLNKNNAYILGYLFTDGSVYGNRVKLHLKREDRYILEFWKKDCEYSGDIHDCLSKCNEKRYPTSKLDITCYEWIDDLSKFSIIPNKTFKTYMPNIPREYFGHFLRGVFDGDGCITGRERKFVKISNGSELFLSELSKKLHNEYGLTERKIYKAKNSRKCSLEYSKKSDVCSLYDIMYKDADIYLKRKKVKFEK